MTAAGVGRILVVGYGNPLCGDDGAGPAVVNHAAVDPALSGAEVRTQHQLTPELALDIAAASLVILVDAGTNATPGDVVVERVDPAADEAAAWSHHVDPAGLVLLTRELFGVAPPVFTVCVGAASMEVGDGLSPAVDAAIPAAARAVVALVEAHRHA